MRFGPIRLAVILLGDRLSGAAIQRNRLETFVVEAENPSETLRAELDARGLSPKTVAIGLARTAVVVKRIELPPVAGEMREMVRFELERHLPFPADDAPFDFVPLPPDGEAGQPASDVRRVLVVAADRRVVDNAVRLAEEAKLRPVSITVAAHDLLALVRTDPKQRVVWVHRVRDTADLLLLHGSTIVLSRSIPADDAQLAAEVRRSFAVARWKNCDAVWASGDAAAAATAALQEVDAPVTAPPYTRRAQQQLAALGEEPSGALELALAVGSRRGIRPLDLIPPALRPRRLTRAQWITAGMLAATAVLSVAALLAPGYREHRRLAAVNAEVARIERDVRAVERVLVELERKRRLLATVETIAGGKVKPLLVLRELTDLLPNDSWLTMLSFDTKGVELTGQAAQASALIPLLENSRLLERAEFASPVTRGREKEQFRIRAAWELAPSATPAAVAPGGAPTPPPSAARPKRDEENEDAPVLRGTPPPRQTPGAPPRAVPGGRRP